MAFVERVAMRFLALRRFFLFMPVDKTTETVGGKPVAARSALFRRPRLLQLVARHVPDLHHSPQKRNNPMWPGTPSGKSITRAMSLNPRGRSSRFQRRKT